MPNIRLFPLGTDYAKYGIVMNENNRVAIAEIPPFILAIHGGREDEVRMLIEKGTDINIADCDGMTPLMAVAMNGNLSIARMLLNAGARYDLTNKWGLTAYDIAIWRGFDVLAALLHEQRDKDAT